MRAQPPAQLSRRVRRLHSFLSSFLSALSSLVSFPFLLSSCIFPFASSRFFYSEFEFAIVVVVGKIVAREERWMTAEGTIRGASVNHEEPRAAREGGERVWVAESLTASDRGRSGTGVWEFPTSMWFMRQTGVKISFFFLVRAGIRFIFPGLKPPIYFYSRTTTDAR